MGLLVYPFFAVAVFIFYGLLIATVITLYVGAYVIVFLLTLAAMAVRSAWRPSYPGRPKLLGGQSRGANRAHSAGDGSVWAGSEAVPQARYSDRR